MSDGFLARWSRRKRDEIRRHMTVLVMTPSRVVLVTISTSLAAMVLWPLALVWAYLEPSKPLAGGPAADAGSAALIDKLHEARQRLAALEARLPQQRTVAGG